MTNDKKKTLVVAGLGVLLLAVGAFQFIGKGSGSQAPASQAKKQAAAASVYSNGKDDKSITKDDADNDPQRQMLMAMVKDPLPHRDPFQPIGAPEPQDSNPAQQPVTQPAQPVQAVKHNGGGRNSNYGGAPVPPFEPLPGGTQIGAPGNGANLTKAAPLRQPSEFAYKVRGILNGPKPMAVFEDDSGNQRLVPLGGSVDGDSKVVGIEKGKVHIRHKGKDKVVDLTEGQ